MNRSAGIRREERYRDRRIGAAVNAMEQGNREKTAGEEALGSVRNSAGKREEKSFRERKENSFIERKENSFGEKEGRPAADDYADIIDLPHHTSEKHLRMAPEMRAAQFAPFAALTGFEEAISETERRQQAEVYARDRMRE